MSQHKTEAEEVVRRYARRAPPGKDARYSALRPEVWLGLQERQRALIDLLSRFATAALDELRVLEVGCGAGGNLLELITLGFNPENLTGNELLPARAALARRNLPTACAVVAGDAMELQLREASFDIVYQSTVFTSLLDAGVRQALAARMWGWVKPGGCVLWYDFIYNNPANPDVRGVPLSELRRLFPAAGSLSVRRVTLAPPISRRVCGLHPLLYHVCNTIPALRTHVLCWIAKPR
jgi:SAM-dependent methyltransferase